MKLFTQIIKTAVNVACLPVDILKDVVTLGGMDQGSAIVKRLEKIKEEAEES
jgi:hypothetical protein